MQEWQQISAGVLSGGIDSRSSVDKIKEGYCEDLVNMDVDISGHVKKRKGYEQVGGRLPYKVKKLEKTYTGSEARDKYIKLYLDSSVNTYELGRSYALLSGYFKDYDTKTPVWSASLETGVFMEYTYPGCYYSLYPINPSFTHIQEESGISTSDLLLTLGTGSLLSRITDLNVSAPTTTSVSVSSSFALVATISYGASSYYARPIWKEISNSVGSSVVQDSSYNPTTYEATCSTSSISRPDIVVSLYKTGASSNQLINPRATDDTVSLSADLGTLTYYSPTNVSPSIKFCVSAADYTDSVTLTGSSGTLVLENVSENLIVSVWKVSSGIRTLAGFYSPPDGIAMFGYDAGTRRFEVTVWGTAGDVFELAAVEGVCRSTSVFAPYDSTATVSEDNLDSLFIHFANEAEDGVVGGVHSYITAEDSVVLAEKEGILTKLDQEHGLANKTTTVSHIQVTATDVYYRLRSSAPSSVDLGYITGTNISNGMAPVSSVEYTAGGVEYVVSVTDLVDSGTFVSDLILYGNYQGCDYLTVQNMPYEALNGTFPIVSASIVDDDITFVLLNADVTDSRYDSTNCSGLAGIFTYPVVSSAAVVLPIDTNVVDSSSDQEFSYKGSVLVDDVYSVILSNITDNLHVGSVLKIDDTLDFLPVSSSSILAGDVVTVGDTSAVVAQATKQPPSDYVSFVVDEVDGITLIGDIPVQVGDKLLLNARLGSTLEEGHWLTGEILTVTSVGSGGIKATASRGGEARSGRCEISNVLFLNKEIVVQSGTEVAVDAVWVGTRSPLTFTGKSEDKTKPVLGKSAVIGDSMFISNGSGKVQKYDGSTVFDAGIISWNPACFVNVNTGGSISPANVPATIAASVVTASAKIPVTLGHETGFLPGDVVEYSSTGARYTVTGTASDATYGYILINSAITATSGQTLTRITRMRYYARLQYIDRNDNVCVSAVTGMYDLDVAISVASNVNFKFITLPPVGVHDFDRIEFELYRAPQNTSSGFRKVITKKVYQDTYTDYIEVTDKLADPVLATQPVDSWSQAVMSSLGYPASEIPVGIEPPPRASQVAVKNNRLLLANISGEDKLDIVFRPKVAGGLTASDLHGYKVWFKKKYSNSINQTGYVDHTVGFEFISSSTTPATIQSFTIDPVTSTAIIVLDITYDTVLSTGSWVYLFHQTNNGDEDLRFSGWHYVCDYSPHYHAKIKLNTDKLSPSWDSGKDVLKCVFPTIDPVSGFPDTILPIWLGTDYNFSQYYTSTPTVEYTAACRLSCAINASNSMVNTRDYEAVDNSLFWLKSFAGGSYKPGQLIVKSFRKEDYPPTVTFGTGSSNFDVFVNGTKVEQGSAVSRIGFESDGKIYDMSSDAEDKMTAIASDGTNIYVVGRSDNIGDYPEADQVAKWDGLFWSPLGSGTKVSGTLEAVCCSGTDVYVSGYFSSIGATAANSIAKWDGSAWSALGSGINNTGRAIATLGTDLYVGGSFTTAGGNIAPYIAKWDGLYWYPIGSPNGSVYALISLGTDLYAGGYFTEAGGVGANYIAKFNGTSWSPLGSGMNGIVKSLAVVGTDLYVGGQFTTAGGVRANSIAKWDGMSWFALGEGIDDVVYAMVAIGTDLYVGGRFTTAGGMVANNIAKYDTITGVWSNVGNGVNGEVLGLAAVGETPYFVGSFVSAYGSEVEASAKSYPSRLLRSATNFPEVFDSPEATESGSIIDVNASDGQEITAVVPFLGESVLGSSTLLSAVAVFKKNSVYVVDTDTKEVAKIDSRNLGCTGAAYPTSDGVMFVNESGVFKLTRSLKVEPVGLYLQGVFDSLVDKANLASSVASYYPLESKFMLSARSKDSETNDIVFAYHVLGEQAGQDTGGGAWSRYDSVPASSWLVVNDDCYFGGTDGNVYRFYKDDEPSSYNDNGEAITSSVLLRTMDFGYPSIRKKLANVVSHFVVDETMASTVLSFAVDHLDTYTSTQAFVVPEPETGISDLSAHREVAVRSSLERPKFRTLQLKYTNSGLNENMVLTGVEFLVTLMKRKGVQQAAKLQS